MEEAITVQLLTGGVIDNFCGYTVASTVEIESVSEVKATVTMADKTQVTIAFDCSDFAGKEWEGYRVR